MRPNKMRDLCFLPINRLTGKNQPQRCGGGSFFSKYWERIILILVNA